MCTSLKAPVRRPRPPRRRARTLPGDPNRRIIARSHLSGWASHSGDLINEHRQTPPCQRNRRSRSESSFEAAQGPCPRRCRPIAAVSKAWGTSGSVWYRSSSAGPPARGTEQVRRLGPVRRLRSDADHPNADSFRFTVAAARFASTHGSITTRPSENSRRLRARWHSQPLNPNARHGTAR